MLEGRSARLLGFVGSPCCIVDEAKAAPVWSEPPVGVVNAQVQAKLRARGEHAVWFIGPLGDEVVDEDSGVGLGAVEGEACCLFSAQGCANSKGRIDSGHQSLAGCFLISTRPVDLTGQIEAGELLDRERAIQLGGVDGVVLDGVAGAEHLGGFEAGDGMHHRGLHLHGQAGAHAVDARADGGDLPGIHRRAMHVFADEAQRLRRGGGDEATHLGQRGNPGCAWLTCRLVDLPTCCAEAEWGGIGVPRLLDELRPVDGAAIESRRGSRLQAALAQAQPLERLAQQDAGRFAAAP